MGVIYKIISNGKDITDAIISRLIEMSITDQQGDDSDSFSISLDNSKQPQIPLPATGTTLDVYLDGIFKGSFEVDELTEPVHEQWFSVHAKSAKIKEAFKAPRDESYDDITLGDLLNIVAGRHGFEPVISEELAAVSYPHIDQVAESDMNLLSRLARDQDAMSKPVANRLVIVKRDQSKSVKGQDLPSFVIDDPQNSTGTITHKERTNYQSVKAYWFDEALQQRFDEVVGTDEPQYVIKFRYGDAEKARTKAEAKLRDLQRGNKTLDLTRPLTPGLVAEAKVIISNHKPTINTNWIVGTVEHRITADNYNTTTLKLHLPKK